jgi:signal transduction histidine kinase
MRRNIYSPPGEQDTDFANEQDKKSSVTPAKNSLFRHISLLISGFLFLLASLFIIITYLSSLHYYQATTQRLNKDVASHIAKFTSPFRTGGLNRKIADSVFYDAMILSPSVEVYFLDTTGKVMYFHAPDSAIKVWHIPLVPIKRYIASKGLVYIKSPDPKAPGMEKIFSAAEVVSGEERLGYIYVILGGNDYQTVSRLLFGDHIITLALQAFGVIFIVSLLVSLLYLNRIKKDLAKVTGVLHAYRNGDYEARFKTDTYKEFAPVAQSFNQMADLLTSHIHRLETSDLERKDFLANISHDLRTPLTVIKGYVETLQQEVANSRPDPQRQTEITTLIYKRLERLEMMIMQLFELSKMEAVGFRLSREPFNLAELLEETVTDSQKAARRKNIHLYSEGSNEMAWINADIALFERMIQNLVDNAIRHTPENGRVHVRLEKQFDNHFLLTIGNTGTALSPELLRWINNDEAGTQHLSPARRGLGLAIVKKIANLHQYELRAGSAEDGIHFSIKLAEYLA